MERLNKCRLCKGNCDCGELVNGVCTECLEEEKQEQIANSSIARIISSPFYQMDLGEFLSG